MKRLLAVLPLLFLWGCVLAQVADVKVEQVGLTALENPKVQKELRFTPQQVKLVQSEFRGYAEATRRMFSGQPTPAQQREKIKELKTLQDGICARVLGSLTAAQRARFRQIVLQGEGIWATLIPEVSRELGLTADQVKRIRGCRVAFGKKVQALQSSRQKEINSIPEPKDPKDKPQVEAYRQKVLAVLKRIRPEDRKSLAAWGKQAMADATAVLTSKQRSKWVAMQGPKFAPK